MKAEYLAEPRAALRAAPKAVLKAAYSAEC